MDPLTVKERSLKSPPLKMAPMSGVMKSSTKALTKAVKEVPTTTATAKSTTLPLNKNCLKPGGGGGDGEGWVSRVLELEASEMRLAMCSMV